MSLPTTFAALTTATGQQLDNNFSALGALTPIPCSVSGTNAITIPISTILQSSDGTQQYATQAGVTISSGTAHS